jgi:hypothetical protein
MFCQARTIEKLPAPPPDLMKSTPIDKLAELGYALPPEERFEAYASDVAVMQVPIATESATVNAVRVFMIDEITRIVRIKNARMRRSSVHFVVSFSS